VVEGVKPLSAQFFVGAPPPQDTVPSHRHPDSMYAKVVVLIETSPYYGNSYTISKTICNNCDSAKIEYIHNEAIRYARGREDLKTTKSGYGLDLGVRYNFPITFELSRGAFYPIIEYKQSSNISSLYGEWRVGNLIYLAQSNKGKGDPQDQEKRILGCRGTVITIDSLDIRSKKGDACEIYDYKAPLNSAKVFRATNVIDTEESKKYPGSKLVEGIVDKKFLSLLHMKEDNLEMVITSSKINQGKNDPLIIILIDPNTIALYRGKDALILKR
jgi:hypothetical protein